MGPRRAVREKDLEISGVSRMLPLMVSGFAALTTVYAVLYYRVFPTTMDWLPPPSIDYCTLNERCVRSDLFAFQMASGLAIVTCAAMGIRSWHLDHGGRKQTQTTATGRLFGYIPEAELLAAVNFTFQFWDFWISLIIPEHRTPLMLAHHLAACVVSWCSIRYRVLHYYGLFFLGISEVSSVFLVFVDLARYFPPIPGTIYDRLIHLLAGPGFVITFVVYRFYYWWPISYQLFQDVYTVTVKTDLAQKLRPGHSWVLYVFLCLNLPLGLLQVYWLTLILGEVQKLLSGG